MVKLKKYINEEIVKSKQIMLVPLTRRYIHMRPPRVWADIVVGLLVICMIIIMMPAKAIAQEEEYLQSLIKHFRFYNTSHGIFAPVYPAIAKQLVEDYGKTKGIAVDLGGADGSLAFALAKVTDLTVYNVDINPGAARICNILADRNQLTGRVRAIEGDATNLPLRDNFADLVFSRNSMIFWPDMILGVREAYRILKPGGVAFMGVGSPRTLDKETLQKLADWAKESGRKMAPVPKDLPKQLSAFGITQVRIIEGPDGSWWVEMRKPVEKK